MKTTGCAFLILFFLAVVLAASAQPAETTAAPSGTTPRVVQGYGKIPLHFEANTGQTDPRVRFLSRGSGYTLFLEDTEAVLSLRKPDAGAGTSFGVGNLNDAQTAVLRMQLVGANPAPQVSPLDPLPATSNYFLGRDPKAWRTNVPLFAKVRYEKVYPGIDLVYYGNQRQLEYDFVVAPGADPQSIRLRFEGATKINPEPDGSLVLTAGSGEVTLRAPIVYQEMSGGRQQVTGRFVLRSEYEAGFEVSAYDESKALVIDPTLVYSTYFGRFTEDHVSDAAVDAAGNVYVIGTTDINDWLPALPTILLSYGVVYDAPPWPLVNPIMNPTNPHKFLFKLSPDGQSLVYSTYISGPEFPVVAADPAGNAYVAGIAGSPDFPLVNPVQANCHIGQGGTCDDHFVFKLSPTGDLIYSTYLGMSASYTTHWNDSTFSAPSCPSIAVDPNGNAYLAFPTGSANLPVVNGFQDNLKGENDMFLVKLDAQGGWAYSTYLGGSGREAGYFPSQTFNAAVGEYFYYWVTGVRIAADAQGNVLVAGTTDSADFPTLNAVQPSYGGQSDVFLTKLNPSGAVVFSTYLGGTNIETPTALAVDPSGNSYLTVTTFSNDFPVIAGRPVLSCGSHSFNQCGILAKFNGNGSIVFTADPMLRVTGVAGLAADSGGNIYISGVDYSDIGGTWTELPLVNPLLESYSGSALTAVEKLDPSATTVLFRTIWSGGYGSGPFRMGLDAANNIYLVGEGCMGWGYPGIPVLNAIQPESGMRFGLTWTLYGYGFGCPTDPFPPIWDIYISKISQADNTPTGTQVAVKPVDGASITFASIASSGTTMFSQQNGAYFYPVNLRVGDPPIYYDVTTSASYTGGITLCLSYSKVHFNLEFDLKLYHYENGAWTDITTSLDTANDIVCGVTTSLSPFAIFGAPLPPMEVVGLAPPLAPLVLEGNNASLPAKAFKLGKTLPLKFQLLVRSVPMTAQEVKAPTIAQLSRVGEPPLNLDTLDLDAGQANDSGYAFRSSDGQWVYNLSTKGLSVGTYSVTIQMPDGRRYVAGFALSK